MTAPANETYFANAGADVIDWPAEAPGEPAPETRLRTVRASAVTMRSVEWVERPLWQGSAFSLLCGAKGAGKGSLTATVAANMTRGAYGRPRGVLFVSSEDSASIDLVPRLAAAGADLDRVEIVVSSFQLPADVDELKALAVSMDDCGLICVDPIANHVGGTDTDKEGQVRYAIGGLNALADELSCMVVGIRHLTKNRAGGALSSVLGSTAWVDLPRAVLAVAADDEDEMVFHVQVVAGNRSGRGAAESFRLELAKVDGLEEPVTKCVALGASSKSVDDLLTAGKAVRGEKKAGAEDVIVRELQTGPKSMDHLKAAVAAEVGASGETTWRAANGLKAAGKLKNGNSGPGTKWLWWLAEEGES